MRSTVSLGTVFLLLTLPAWAAGADVKTSEITLKSGDEEIKAFLAEPAGKGPFPGIVVIQEWWGLTDWIKENAKHFASQGYVAVAPDLYRGKVATDPGMAGQLMKGMPQDRALRDLKAATSFLASRENVQKDRLGSIGWCMGGGLSLQLALNDPQIKACAICYGRVVTEVEKLKGLNGPVLGVFGEQDKGIPVTSVRYFETAVKQAGKQVEGMHVYKAGHGFMRDNNGPSTPNPEYREGPAKEAWQVIDAFFAKTLGGK
jgi:carboxymethylenebutenolidase